MTSSRQVSRVRPTSAFFSSGSECGSGLPRDTSWNLSGERQIGFEFLQRVGELRRVRVATRPRAAIRRSRLFHRRPVGGSSVASVAGVRLRIEKGRAWRSRIGWLAVDRTSESMPRPAAAGNRKWEIGNRKWKHGSDLCMRGESARPDFAKAVQATVGMRPASELFRSFAGVKIFVSAE